MERSVQAGADPVGLVHGIEPDRTGGEENVFKRITIKTIENTATLEANLRSADVDYISGVLGLSMDQGLAMAREPALQQKYDFEFPLGLV